WPGIASIQATLENGTWHMCAGALIHPQWVLTVAQCFIGAGDTSAWKVLIGATDLTQPGPEAERRRIERVLVHQDYDDDSAWNNIALLELDEPVECSDYIQLACVPDSSLAVPELRTCYIAGWRAAPTSLPLPIPGSPSHCPRVPKARRSAHQPHPVPPVTPGCGCEPGAAPDPSLPAQGDSGGPLVCKDNAGDYFWLVGLASWGKGCAGDRRPGIFTSTQHFHTWIQVQMGLV
ncbi:ACRO protein, partial [Machaerirhynchus nigripectus]|nr:ACRO protein [Machaerirhynchus nigripectus]